MQLSLIDSIIPSIKSKLIFLLLTELQSWVHPSTYPLSTCLLSNQCRLWGVGSVCLSLADQHRRRGGVCLVQVEGYHRGTQRQTGQKNNNPKTTKKQTHRLIPRVNSERAITLTVMFLPQNIFKSTAGKFIQRGICKTLSIKRFILMNVELPLSSQLKKQNEEEEVDLEDFNTESSSKRGKSKFSQGTSFSFIPFFLYPLCTPLLSSVCIVNQLFLKASWYFYLSEWRALWWLNKVSWQWICSGSIICST